jgi:DNA modification methylase
VIHHGDLFDVLPTLAETSIDSCVTDPPYGIGFMGKKWDTFSPDKARASKHFAINNGDHGRKDSPNPNLRGRRQTPAMSPSQIEYDRSLTGSREFQDWTEAWAREVLRVLKPGAYLLVCGAPRSYHRMVCGVEDAGFEVRDSLMWIFGQGFPKSLNLGDGRGTALKPSYEPIILARKPCEGSTTATFAKHGTGTLNIDACRIGTSKAVPASVPKDGTRQGQGIYGQYGDLDGTESGFDPNIGRWPANVLLDEDAAEILDAQSGQLTSGDSSGFFGDVARSQSMGDKRAMIRPESVYADSGGASRFFYVAKPSRSERDAGCHELPTRQRDETRKAGDPGGDNPRNRGLQQRGNSHPTVKPIDLMRWLVRLVTPIDGIVLDPFTGSGTTGCACAYEGRLFVGIERESEYVAIAERRIASCVPLLGIGA